MTKLTIAAVQAEPIWLDKAETTTKTINLIAQAAAGGADLVAFPELWVPGFPVFLFSHPVYAQSGFVARYHAESLTAAGEEIGRIAAAAREHGIVVVVGFSEKVAGTLYMSQMIIDADGEIALHRRKLKPTHVERSLFGESDGSGIRVASTTAGRVGALNCFEHLQPLTKYAMFHQNEQIHVAAWPCLGIMGDVPAMSPDALKSASRVYALEGGVFVATASQIMSDAGAAVFADASGSCPIYTGGGGIAAVFGPDSAELSTPLPTAEEGIVYATIDFASIDLARNTVDPTAHYARTDVFQLLFDDRPKAPVIRIDDERPALGAVAEAIA
ncbi:carbon-nitrogen hydrolase family protein [Microbacterium sp. KSW2-21]|uniref:Carbon-nitrogen hydrolase family protein n=1 Tax=Microbacterium algihabitans TaxID=3075992 RepID=A0ABU3S023_9MICO|nr:carbon-nitrogen hydrolase family protein [Microbacterium sp. KSW2-21]MDU0328458.1 carbon-nitrogen hydrolase family protein [Microbacterium sp. KSW2-21]